MKVNSSYSTSRPLLCCVPQGSCLGPWLYLTYAGTLFDEVPPEVSVYGFADDHIANVQFVPDSFNEAGAICTLQQSATTINNWMKSNKLKMNTDKTEFIMFGGQFQLNKCHTTNINIAGDVVSRVKAIKYLGAILDQFLSFKDHVNAKCRTAMFNYFRIKSIRKYLTKESTEVLLLSLVISHLDYCNVILYGITESDIFKLQRIQSMCAKLVLGRDRYASSKQALFDLHWLPIKARITFKILSFMYNCSKGHAPAYLLELLSKPDTKRSGLRSGDSVDSRFVVPFNKRKTFSDRSFSTVGPKLWNELPLSIRAANTILDFKRKLKIFYFDQFYSLF